MGVKINVGYCQKIGLPNYGSEGAHCNLELEVDSSLLNTPGAFQERVQEIYAACRQAVHSQLQATDHQTAKEQPKDSRPSQQASQPRGNGLSRPSEKQSKYAEQLAAQVKGLGLMRLDSLCERMYRKPFGSLSGLETSNLIDTLREAKAGRLDLSAV